MVRFRFVLRGAEQIGTSLSVKRFAVLLLKYGLLMLALLVTAALSAVTTTVSSCPFWAEVCASAGAMPESADEASRTGSSMGHARPHLTAGILVMCAPNPARMGEPPLSSPHGTRL